MQNEVEVMRIIRVPPMGALVVHADGERYKQLTAVNNEMTRRRLLAAIGELVTFAGGYDALVEAGLAPPLANATPASAPVVDHGQELEAPGLQEIPDMPAPAGGNLVSEIDLILQRHLATDERLAQRSIHLRQPPGQLLQIVVDGRVYEHPNDIEDPHVKAVLKQALKEWESR